MGSAANEAHLLIQCGFVNKLTGLLTGCSPRTCLFLSNTLLFAYEFIQFSVDVSITNMSPQFLNQSILIF